jgi:glycosyltransferase involved in cell wall biosynthesis
MDETRQMNAIEDGERPPLVSVVVPTRDRPDRLRRAIASIQAQDYVGPIEVVVVFDRTEEVELDPGPDPLRSITTIENDRTPGPAGARNAAAEAANGEILAFCDDDDRWLPKKLRLQVNALSPEVSAVTCGIVVRYSRRSVPRVPDRDRITLEELIRSRMGAVHTSSLVVRRRDYLGRIGPLDESLPGGYGEDYEWLLRAASWRPVGCVREPLVDVHWHDASWFDGRWDTIVEAIDRLLELHPEIRGDRAGLARLFGRVAFAHAAAGRRGQAFTWSRRALAQSGRERRAYLAVAVACGLPADAALKAAHTLGRGI